jgi:hypothetical protein
MGEGTEGGITFQSVAGGEQSPLGPSTLSKKFLEM